MLIKTSNKLQKDDILKFLMTLNKSLNADKIPESQLEESFNLWWPKLFEKIEKSALRFK